MTEREGVQEFVDRFYWSHGGPCCAGCDWWRHLNSSFGECLRSAPVASAERWAMVGVDWHTLPPATGHAVTSRGHNCGEFRDGFDWASLPLPYLRRIGATP